MESQKCSWPGANRQPTLPFIRDIQVLQIGRQPVAWRWSASQQDLLKGPEPAKGSVGALCG